MRDVPSETPCEYCNTSVRGDFKTKASFGSHRSICKKKLNEGPSHHQPQKKKAKQSASAAVKSATRNRATGTGGPSLPLKLGSTVDVIFGMRPDGRAVPKYTSAVIVDVARVENFDQTDKYAALLAEEDGNDATTSKAATCEYVYQVDYKDEALPLQLPGSGKINPLCEPV
jgi:hypothetical protein